MLHASAQRPPLQLVLQARARLGGREQLQRQHVMLEDAVQQCCMRVLSAHLCDLYCRVLGS